MDEIINKVAQSGLETIDLEDYYPVGDIVVFDMKDYLFMEQILKEKDFRAAMQSLDWEQYRGKNVGLLCSADAVIPLWAYMLVMTNLEPGDVLLIAGKGHEDYQIVGTAKHHFSDHEVVAETLKGL